MRARTMTVTVTAAMAAALALAPATSATASGHLAASAVDCNFGGGSPDFDSDCAGDLAVGVPLWDSGALVDAGAVQVNHAVGGAAAAPVLLTASSLGFEDESGSQFGAALLVAQVDGSGPTDLVIGAPGASVDGVAGAGAVYVVYGAAGGLGTGKASQRITESSWGLTNGAARFGAALAVWSPPWDADPPVFRLAIGAPEATVDGAARAGHVVVTDLPGLASGVAISQGHGAPGAAEPGDRFGLTLAGRGNSQWGYLAIGIPFEDVGSTIDAGAIAILGPEGPLGFSQDSPGVPGSAEAGDRFGAALAIVAQPFGDEVYEGVLVGVPAEDVGRIKDAGALNLLDRVQAQGDDPEDPPPASWVPFGHLITAASPGFPGAVETGDVLGSALSDSFVGIPSEDIGSVHDAGAACMVDWWETKLSGRVSARCVNQDSPGIPGVAEAGDRFGFAVGSFKPLDEDDPLYAAAIGIPGEDASWLNQGMVVAGDLFGDWWGSPGTTIVPNAQPQAGAALGRSLMR